MHSVGTSKQFFKQIAKAPEDGSVSSGHTSADRRNPGATLTAEMSRSVSYSRSIRAAITRYR